MMNAMTTAMATLMRAVDAAFARRDPTLVGWPDPHAAHRDPLPEEYSRVTEAAKWRIIRARADAWVGSLVDLHLAEARSVAPTAIDWVEAPVTRLTSASRVEPFATGALPLIVARGRIENVPDAGITLGLGEPAQCVGWFPHCGCDACDSGSEPELETLDDLLTAIIGGGYRRLTRGDRVVVQLPGVGGSAAGEFEPGEVKRILADPRGWRELRGAPWTA